MATEREILGVKGRAFQAHRWPNGLYSSQTWKASRVRGGETCLVELRFDDDCRNGHQSFAITGTLYEGRKGPKRGLISAGAMHETIIEWFPELAPLVKWHLTATDGPIHYEGNTIYHAGDRDYRGLRKGERRQLHNGRTGLPCWRAVVIREDGSEIETHAAGLSSIVDSPTVPDTELGTLEWRAVWIEGEGKERQLDYARNSAVWPDATDEQLCAEPEELRAMLRERLPALIAEFRHAMVDVCGFDWVEGVRS